MRKLIALLSLLAGTTYAELPHILFGTENLLSPLTTLIPTTVQGPLLQLQTKAGTILSFQHGASFTITAEGDITLHSGNLRIGPAGGDSLTLTLPTGPITIAPNTALTITVETNRASGRVYSGTLTTPTRTFTQGQGFILTSNGAEGTFTPAAAQTPDYINLAAIAPAAGPATSFTPPQPTPNLLAATTPALLQPSAPSIPETPSEPEPEPKPETSTTEEPAITPPETTPELPAEEEPKIEEPASEQPSTDEPSPQPEQEEPEIAPPATEQPQPEQPSTGQPEQPQPEQPELPQPEQPQPEAPAVEAPTPLNRTNLYAAWSEALPNTPMANGRDSTPLLFTMGTFADGTQQLTQTQSRYNSMNLITLNAGSALQQDVFSHNTGSANGTVSGLGRWVGGELISVSGPAYNPAITPITNPASIHYVWGEKPSAIPTAGTLTYTLLAATQPTYTGGTTDGPGTFTGNLAVNFAPGFSGVVGTYHLTGTVTMPQTTMVVEGPEAHAVTTPTSYQISTPSQGVPLRETFSNPGTLTVTAPTGAIACPSGCTGTVNAAGFGTGMKDVGTLYTINPGGQTGITGAAIFTTNP